jgi:hypothetical protein
VGCNCNNPLDVYRRFGGVCCFYLRGIRVNRALVRIQRDVRSPVTPVSSLRAPIRAVPFLYS